jgi:hypothetical protein
MDYKFLDKVLDQIVSETEIDHEWGRLYTPFFPLHSISPTFFLSHSTYFSDHCKNVYGLNEDEIKYVWEEYVQIFRDKINNGL